jgi:hypothetical protein
MGQVSGKIDSFVPVADKATSFYYQYRKLSLIFGAIMCIAVLSLIAYMVYKMPANQPEKEQ